MKCMCRICFRNAAFNAPVLFGRSEVSFHKNSHRIPPHCAHELSVRFHRQAQLPLTFCFDGKRALFVSANPQLPLIQLLPSLLALYPPSPLPLVWCWAPNIPAFRQNTPHPALRTWEGADKKRSNDLESFCITASFI